MVSWLAVADTHETLPLALYPTVRALVCPSAHLVLAVYAWQRLRYLTCPVALKTKVTRGAQPYKATHTHTRSLWHTKPGPTENSHGNAHTQHRPYARTAPTRTFKVK